MDKTGREIALRENLKSLFAHVTNTVTIHMKGGMNETLELEEMSGPKMKVLDSSV